MGRAPVGDVRGGLPDPGTRPRPRRDHAPARAPERRLSNFPGARLKGVLGARGGVLDGRALRQERT